MKLSMTVTLAAVASGVGIALVGWAAPSFGQEFE
jgi:hypothetical protein